MPSLLIVEDDPDIRRMVRRFFGARGFDVLEAADAQRAVSALSIVRPDAVVLDQRVPGGCDRVLSTLAREPHLREVACVIASGAEPRDHERCAAFVAKPYTLDELFSAVAAAIDEAAPAASPG